MDLESVEVLWRQNDTMSLWGIPHKMRPGQSPRDLHEAGNTKGWVWMGTPGWWGSITEEDRGKLEPWLEDLGDIVPTHPGEFSTISDFR